MIEVTQNHEYVDDGKRYPSVTTILKQTGFINTAYFTEYGRKRGSLVHQIIHWYILEILDESTVDPALIGYLEAWKAFEKDTGYVSIDVEKSLVNHPYAFAGTPDNVGVLDVADTVIDYKSGSVSAWVGLQLAGYEILIGKRMKRFALQLKETGKYVLKEFKESNDRWIFQAAVSCYQWQQNNK